MYNASKNHVKYARKITKFDTMNYHVLESMEDLVRVSSPEGHTVFENSVMKQAKEDEMLVDAITRSQNSALSEFSKDLNTRIKKEVEVGDKVYSLNISSVFDDNNNHIGYVEVFRDITYDSLIRSELIRMRNKTEDDIGLAKNIQKSILPTLSSFKNVGFQYGHVASEQLSGDIFDVILIDKDRLGIYIADVVGHGISASIMTMFIRETMRNILAEHPSFGASETVMEIKKRFGLLKLDASQYFTLVYAEIDTLNNKLTYVNAGHNATPIMFNDSKVAMMSNRGRFISNIFPDMEYKEKTLDLIPGDSYLFYTDGLLETTDVHGEFFGVEKLMKWIDKNKKEERIVNKLIRDVNSYRWLEQKDDIAILYINIEGEK